MNVNNSLCFDFIQKFVIVLKGQTKKRVGFMRFKMFWFCIPAQFCDVGLRFHSCYNEYAHIPICDAYAQVHSQGVLKHIVNKL